MESIKRSWSITTAPDGEPISLQALKAYLRIPYAVDDYLLEAILMPAAREAVEAASRRQLMLASVTMKLDAFPANNGEITCPRPPLSSVTSINYINGDGTSTLLSSSLYQVDASSTPGRIMPSYGNSWPSTRGQMNAVSIVYVAGYATEAAVPAGLKTAIMQIVGAMHENKEMMPTGDLAKEIPASVMLAIQYLIDPHRVEEFF
jgi:uncharacterized phiE125 gp8 family phage protein